MFVSKEVKRFGWSGVNISTASLPALTAVFGRQTPAKPENTLQLWRTLNTQRRGGGKNFGLCPPFPYPPQNGQNKKATGKETKGKNPRAGRGWGGSENPVHTVGE